MELLFRRMPVVTYRDYFHNSMATTVFASARVAIGSSSKDERKATAAWNCARRY